MPGRLPLLGLTLSATFLLSACGGQEYSQPLAPQGNPPSPLFEPWTPPTNTQTETGDSEPVVSLPISPGYYETTVNVEEGNTYSGVATIIDPDGSFVTFISQTDATFGVLGGTGENQIVGAGTNIFYSETWDQVDGTVSGQATDSETATLKVEAPETGYRSVVELSRSNGISDTPIAIADLAGSYLMQDSNVVTTQITINADGSLTGTDQRGCIFNGSVNIPDTSVNVFRVLFTAENCGSSGGSSAEQRNGDYRALGVFGGDQILVIGTNSAVITYFRGLK
ncbi:hypothetical protein DET50_11051 [Marinobacter pelagius]|uniref:Uncharacterized protein n=1 Tax=Marinobacter pelagius TaxID=379482 RepID=A0A366GNQ7_9GAMM|nr:hypothetical protein [Marinobacter pelagius]RBP29152.1 hypothetical protein DET50_11051 [Marinobacter pelagius]